MAATTVPAPEVLGWAELEAMFGPDVVAELAGPDPFDSVVSPEVDPLDVIARCERLIAMLQGEQLSNSARWLLHAHADGGAGVGSGIRDGFRVGVRGDRPGVGGRAFDLRLPGRGGGRSRAAPAGDPGRVVRR